MPTEDRRLIFRYDEAYKAIYTLCVQKEIRKPPAGTIVAIGPTAGDKSQITIKIQNPQLNEEKEIEI
jgi:hypothetical protein